MDLLYDHREEKSGVPDLLRELGLSLEAAQLSEGDYHIGEKICIERKSATDFVASIKDGRLWDQLARMKQGHEIVIVLLEGEPLFPAASLEGAYAGIIRRGAALFRVRDQEETASFIHRLWKQENSPRSARRPKQTRKWRGEDEIAEDSLAALPGISVKKAGDLLEHFGSLGAVTNASQEDLQQVPGIGKKTAQDLYLIFTHKRGSVPWD